MATNHRLETLLIINNTELKRQFADESKLFKLYRKNPDYFLVAGGTVNFIFLEGVDALQIHYRQIRLSAILPNFLYLSDHSVYNYYKDILYNLISSANANKHIL